VCERARKREQRAEKHIQREKGKNNQIYKIKKERRTEPRLTHQPARDRAKHTQTKTRNKPNLARGGKYRSEENAVLKKAVHLCGSLLDLFGWFVVRLVKDAFHSLVQSYLIYIFKFLVLERKKLSRRQNTHHGNAFGNKKHTELDSFSKNRQGY
jgi:hypothetical protein